MKNKRDDFLSDSELEQLLRDDFRLTEEKALSTEELMHITDLLAQRQAQSTADSWQSFQHNYLLETDVGNRPHAIRTSGRLVAAMMALVLLAGGSLGVRAGRKEPLKLDPNRTPEFFYFGTPDSLPSLSDREVFPKLRQTLEENGITASVVPTWIPDRYLVEEVYVNDNPMDRVIIGQYNYNDDILDLWVSDHVEGNTLFIHKDDSPVEIYTHNGVEYHIFTNLSIMNAAWLNDGYECSLSGPVTREEMKMMINSII